MDYFLILNEKHSPTQQFGAICHELGHVLCGHLGTNETRLWSERHNLSGVTQEFEAEAIAYMVGDRLGLDFGSDSYLSGYVSCSRPLPKYSLDSILKAVRLIEEMTATGFRVRKRK